MKKKVTKETAPKPIAPMPPDLPEFLGWGPTYVCTDLITLQPGCGAMFKVYNRAPATKDALVVCPLCGRAQTHRNENVFNFEQMIKARNLSKVDLKKILVMASLEFQKRRQGRDIKTGLAG